MMKELLAGASLFSSTWPAGASAPCDGLRILTEQKWNGQASSGIDWQGIALVKASHKSQLRFKWKASRPYLLVGEVR